MKNQRKKRMKRPDRVKMNAMMALIKEGKSRQDVAKLYGYSSTAVCRWAVEHNLGSHKRKPKESIQLEIKAEPKTPTHRAHHKNVDERISRHDKSLKGIVEGMEHISEIFRTHEEKFKMLEAEIHNLEQSFIRLTSRANKNDLVFKDLERWFKKLNEQVQENHVNILARFDQEQPKNQKSFSFLWGLIRFSR